VCPTGLLLIPLFNRQGRDARTVRANELSFFVIILKRAPRNRLAI
jgi:hypothetical protein